MILGVTNITRFNSQRSLKMKDILLRDKAMNFEFYNQREAFVLCEKSRQQWSFLSLKNNLTDADRKWDRK